ncbi:hypothetical protein CEXT_254231 [Caerostris extrusa]|uniref:Uncharacterized protein n=1 Tax=Caerostris extrusa TaxID=172846 RepID=A0AAV4X1W7_CAEEX|nr:hypothetical protein CEXT_254231 [Caerostris extrusa]
MKLETTEAGEFIHHFLPIFCSCSELWLNWSLGKERTAGSSGPNDGRPECIAGGESTVACRGTGLEMRHSGIAKWRAGRNGTSE